MGIADRGHFPARRQPFQTILPDRLQHPEARFPGGIDLTVHYRLVDKALHEIEGDGVMG